MDGSRFGAILRTMSNLSFTSRVPAFDANVGVGHRNNRRYPFDEPLQLVEEMARHGVDQALVYACHGETISPMHGNEALERWTGGENGLVPQYMVGADPESLRQIQGLHASGLVTHVRLHCTEMSRTPFVDWIYAPVLEWLVAEDLPLWVSMADTPPTEIVDTLTGYPDLRAVIVGAHYAHSAMALPMLRVLPNATLELSRYENTQGIEQLVEAVGANRLIYGSFFPRYAMGPILYMLNHLSIDDSDLAAICAGNVEKLIEGSVTDDK